MNQSPKNIRQVTALLGVSALLIGAALAACDSFAPPTTLASPTVEAAAGSSATVSAEPSALAGPSGTPEPFPVSEATVMEATRRASYAERATQAVRDGQPTLEPYETIWARETSFYVERTQVAESLFTPTPFGALPFPGTRLTDEELAERGWPRMGPGGIRNEDYHTTAFWLDKEYVDAEIFSKYEALFDLLAFRDGPPGDDFEARLGELMMPDEQGTKFLSSVIDQDVDNQALANCTYGSTLSNVKALFKQGLYVSFEPEQVGRTMGWEWGNRLPLLEVLVDKVIAYQVGQDYIVLLNTVLVNPNGVVNSLSVHYQTRKVFDKTAIRAWYANLDPTRSDANAMMVWQPTVGQWRAFVFGSPYCEGQYPGTIQK